MILKLLLSLWALIFGGLIITIMAVMSWETATQDFSLNPLMALLTFAWMLTGIIPLLIALLAKLWIDQ